ncbi:MAG: hypothetical protein DHS20C15_32760 [Planctomycetota bacterium]|nr:MAG: hypothetical protein DHS20C15_32760 [Planctomycetota bacterium]
MSGRHEVMLASAGTGKTHALSQQLLALLLGGTEPSSVLGTTFTRKAAGEISERLHERLLHALDDEASRAQLPAGADGELPRREACVALLLALLRGGDPLHVETLDAFFGRLAQAFGAELELPPDWRLVDAAEDQRLREQVLSRLLAESDREELLELLRAWRGAGAEGARATHESLQDDIASTYELWLDAAPDAFAPPEPSDLPDEARLAQLVAAFAEAPLPVTKSKGTEVSGFVKARTALLEALAEENWRALLEHTMSERALLDDAQFARADFTPPLRESLRALIAAGLLFLEAELARRTRAMGSLLARFHEMYTAAKRAAGALRFDDLPRALERVGSLSPALLAHRTEAQLQHLLLDEFQDTSPLQWRVFEQLVQPLLAARELGSLVAVGDLKQSLYAFRGGDSRLLAGLAERHDLRSSGLEHNYRSAPELLDFVQAVFSHLDRCSVFDNDPGLRAARALWLERWVTPRAAKPDLEGCVRVHRVPCDDASADQRRELLAGFTAQRIAALREREPERSIGVLLRTNKPVAQMLQALRAEGVPAGGAGGAPLTDSNAVRVLLSALRFAEHPGDGLARLHLELTPLGAALGLVPEAQADTDVDAEARAGAQVDPRALAEARAEADDALAAALRQRWALRGTAGLVEELRALLEAHESVSTWDDVRLGQLVELAERHDELPDLRLADFLARVESEAVAHPDAQGVQVLTIHKSKGLAFDTVVLPELEGVSFNREASPLVQRSDPFARIERVWIGGSIAWIEQHATLSQRLHEATARSAEGDLCSLYVALTRARTRLELVLPDAERGKPARSYAGLISEAVDLSEWESTWQAPSDDHVPAAPDTSAVPTTPAARATPTASADTATDAHASLDADRDTNTYAARWIASTQALGDPDTWSTHSEEARLRGLVWHAWCEELTWLDADGAPEFDAEHAQALALAALLGDGADTTRLALRDEWRSFLACLRAPEVRAVLTLDSASDELHAAGRPRASAASSGSTPSLELWRERAFQFRDEQGAPSNGRFDRVHVSRAPDGRALSAEVIDFKTGRAPAADDLVTQAAHRSQMQRYCDALVALLQLEASAVSASLLYLADGQRVRVSC